MPYELKPDYLFEVSWEVCNKVGGIYTVLATKARILEQEWHEQLIMIGPDVWKGATGNPDFLEDKTLFKLWKQYTDKEGLKIRIGRWNIPGKPIAVLVDFTPFFLEKDDIFTDYWIKYQLDSLSGQWDYIEPAMFGYAAGKVIECFYRCHINSTDHVVAQFHEWMTGAGVLYLEDNVPQIATVFTTHATVVGRAIAGNGLPFYKNFSTYNADQVARDFGVISKHSLEKIAAATADCFTTVSDNTAAECRRFLGLAPDIVTPNGFDISIVPQKSLFDSKRKAARQKILQVAAALFCQQFGDDTLLVIKSGRYEFKNKGIDIFIDSIGLLNTRPPIKKNVVAVIFVPGHHTGPRKELLDWLAHPGILHSMRGEILTHNLQGAESDPILTRIRQNHLDDNPDDKVKVIFVPTYVNGDDGIFNLPYYDLLIGFDLAVFPSYYEPWGYTPLESLAFHIPAITTNISGFGTAIGKQFNTPQKGIDIITRDDDNAAVVTETIANYIHNFAEKTEDEIADIRNNAYAISEAFLWERQIGTYKNAYSIALEKSQQRKTLYRNKPQVVRPVLEETTEMKPLWREVVIPSKLPAELLALKKLSMNLWWSWNDDALELFEDIDIKLFKKCHYNPVLFLQLLNYDVVEQLLNDAAFLSRLNTVEREFDAYCKNAGRPNQPLVAYFCMEYGLHNSIKLYSGGLGILAGDYLKEASDRDANMVGIGLLYKGGYFQQSLSVHGEQLAEPDTLDFATLPLETVCSKDGKALKIPLAFPGRTVYAQAWRLAVGRITLYLLDTYIDENAAEDKDITSRLYLGGEEMRLKQEVLLGIGGVALLKELDIQPDIFHCNEGHAAFLGLARLNGYIQGMNLSFEEAVECVRSSQLFTTHTSLPAAIDKYSEELMRPYFSYTAQQFNVNWETFMGLGKAKGAEDKFSMTYLAAKLSQEINAVSKIHQGVSQLLFHDLWPDYKPEEVEIGFVTNGIHTATWTASEWKQLNKQYSTDAPGIAAKIAGIPANEIWNVRMHLKRKLLQSVRDRLTETLMKQHEGPRKIEEAISNLKENAFLIGFARRFVVYKRPDLLFSNLQRLSTIVKNSQRPVLFFFSGKAHPNDKVSSDLVKNLVAITQQAEFKNKIFFLEDYDMNLARLMVQGVDLWLNTPDRRMEASGTSGMKAMANGVLNFSVMDGWWAEAYNEQTGWALDALPAYENQGLQDELDAEKIYQALENEIIPLYFKRDSAGLPPEWIERIRLSIEQSGQYSMTRVLREYQSKFYQILYDRTQKMKSDNFRMARQIASWKKDVTDNWKEIDVLSLEPDIGGDENNKVKIVLDTGNLPENSLGVETVVLNKNESRSIKLVKEIPAVKTAGKSVTFEGYLPALHTGLYEYSFRIFPKNDLLAKRSDFPLVKWI